MTEFLQQRPCDSYSNSVFPSITLSHVHGRTLPPRKIDKVSSQER